MDVPIYQTLVTFTEDSDARLFEKWLQSVGFDEFRKWAKKATRCDKV
jgi:uncharacterized caspase-like protein